MFVPYTPYVDIFRVEKLHRAAVNGEIKQKIAAHVRT